ncbi:MAG: hypothetical protein FJ125_03110, partial [Deltaproteobacteria bacterium]|nr:hypothetical protein [Deltaproteobacteria bacterium]
ARRLRQIGAALVERHGGLVPSTLAELVSLPGVGRKTANVVLGAGFGKVEGLVVDTHVLRVARRLGLHTAADPLQAEQELMALLPRERWIAASHRLIFHGRRACLARRPRCLDCVLADLCPSAAPGAAEARRGSGSTGAVDGRTAPPEEERR